MKLKCLILFFLLSLQYVLLAQKQDDSLVVFADLKFHSEFEKAAISNYVLNKTDTLDLFLAIDPTMTKRQADAYGVIYQSIVKSPYIQKMSTKKVTKKVRKSFMYVHKKYLQKYSDVEFLPSLFQNGSYNCVTSSILYSMLFDELDIPCKVVETVGHVYLVANPGPKSIVVETTNPKLDKPEVIESYKRLYVGQLRTNKIIGENEFKSKSVAELFEENTKKVWPAEFDNLIGFQYYNLALVQFSEKKIKESYESFQKAYFFHQSEKVGSVMYNLLLQQINKCKFEQVSDIDYIAYLTRYNELSFDLIDDAFLNIIDYHLQFTDRQAFCDSISKRLISKVNDAEMAKELCFNYNLKMGKHFRSNQYIDNALAIKQNHKETNELFAAYIEDELKNIFNYKELLEQINLFKKKYDYNFAQQILKEQELIAHLEQAYDFLKYNYIEDGEKYLKVFEESTTSPIDTDNHNLIRSVETAYRTLAIFYFYHKDKKMAINTINRGLKYVPESRFLQTAVY